MYPVYVKCLIQIINRFQRIMLLMFIRVIDIVTVSDTITSLKVQNFSRLNLCIFQVGIYVHIIFTICVNVTSQAQIEIVYKKE